MTGTNLENLDLETDEALQDGVTDGDDDSTAKPDADKAVWDKNRQELDNERANARRARAELASVTEAYEAGQARLDQLEQELVGLKSAQKEEQSKLDDMDPELVDAGVAKNIKTLENLIRDKDRQLKEITNKISIYEQQQAQAEAKRRNEEAKEAVLSTVEDLLEDAGYKGAAKYRNEANKLADTWVDEGKVSPVKTYTEGCKLLRKCYLHLINSKKESKSVSVDTGKGSPSATGKKTSGIKPGTLAEVKAQMLADRSWLDTD